MTDPPSFTIVDRRKLREDESTTSSVEASVNTPAPVLEETPTKAGAPRLTLVEPTHHATSQETQVALADEASDEQDRLDAEDEGMPPAPTAEESRFQVLQYEQAAERLDTLVRSQNPGIPAPEKIGFEHLVQQLYLSAMMQMGAGTPDGQRPRVDILGARQTIDLLGVVVEKTKENLSASEERTLQTVLFELRGTFLELTRMIASQPQPPLPPPPGGIKR